MNVRSDRDRRPLTGRPPVTVCLGRISRHVVVTAVVVIQAVAVGLVPAKAQDGLLLTPHTGVPGIEVVASAPNLTCHNPDDAYDEPLDPDQGSYAEQATLWWDQEQLPDGKVETPDGALVATFAVPADASPGMHTVTLRCAASDEWVVAATFVVLPEYPEPQLQLSPTSASPRAEVTAQGSAFNCSTDSDIVEAGAMGGPLTLLWDDGRVLREVATTPNGTFVTTFAVPADAPVGQHRLTAQCDETKDVAHASFDVRIEEQASPTLTTSPQSAAAGAEVTAEGTGFTCDARSLASSGSERRGGPLTLWWHDGRVLGEVATARDGTFVASFVVPADAAPGDYTVTARCESTDDTADAGFVVEEVDRGDRHLTVSPPSGVPGTVVTAAGAGLPCHSEPSDEAGQVELSLDDLHVATGTTDGGSFLITFTVPADAAVGRHDVTATCAGGDTDESISAGFKVEPWQPAQLHVPTGEIEPGGDVEISGQGFPPTCADFAVRLADEVVPLDDHNVNPVDARGRLGVVGRFEVPGSSPAGNHKVVLECRTRDGALVANAAGTITVADTDPPLGIPWLGLLLVLAGLLAARQLRRSRRQREWVRRHVRLEPRRHVPDVDLHSPETAVSRALRLEPRPDGGTLETEEVIR